jgi:hypothetical protein
MLKKLLYVAAGLVLLLVVGVFIVFLSINSIAKRAIEKGGTYALGTDTSVSSVSVGVFKGEFSMSGLKVANPSSATKFESPHFLTLGTGSTAVTLSTLRQPTVEIPTLTLDKLDANIESKGGATNYGAILDHLKTVTGGDSSKPAPADPNEKKFIIRELKLTNLTIHVDMGAAVGGVVPGGLGKVGDVVNKVTTVTIPIDKIELHDVGKGNGGVGDSGVSMSQLTGIIVKAVLAAAAEKGGGLIPTDLLGDLRGKLSSVANLDALSKGGIEIVGGAATKVGDEVKKGVEDATKGIGDALKGVLPGRDKKK